MPGLKLADDLSTALVPPFKLKSIAQSEKQIDGASEPSTTSVGVRKQSYNITLPVLAGLIASSFILGIIATYGFMAGYQIAAL